MQEFVVYILFSDSLGKYYTGSSENLEARLGYHNSGNVKFTSTGMPWRLVWNTKLATRSEAVKLENVIKKRGAKRYLIDLDAISC
ncbi:MAG: GIY-YIG nuclease family protein [Bacteroidetes bacterium]|nr:GIY-YIG nuclease family protein [Bacteroidota bacterium]